MLREYKICGNMIKYINIYNAYHIHVLNKPFVSLFLGSGGSRQPVLEGVTLQRLLHFSLSLRPKRRQQHITMMRFHFFFLFITECTNTHTKKEKHQ